MVKGSVFSMVPCLQEFAGLALRAGMLALCHAVALHAPIGEAAEGCSTTVARIMSAQGLVEARSASASGWREAKQGTELCAGDSVRVATHSRAVLRLANESTMPLDQNTEITLNGLAQDRATSLIELLKGVIHLITRTPKPFRVNTPFMNAGIEGTEFYIAVSDDSARVGVFEGKVNVSNDRGSLLLMSNETAYIAKNVAPKLDITVKPRDAVQWALYYPPIIDPRYGAVAAATEIGEQSETNLQQSIELYRQGKIVEVFAALDQVAEAARTARFHVYRAGVLLSVGRVDEARADIDQALKLDPNNSAAYAQQTIIAVVQNQKEQALSLANKAVQLDPKSSAAKIALSYAEQANFKIDQALKTTRQATAIDPDNALAWARVAELEMSTANLDKALEAAKKAASLNPNLARTQSVLGFANLTRIDTQAAKQAFHKAIELDQADPLPRLGLGLARIREGDLKEGREEIEIATSLDPESSLIRSYLAKAYYEENRDKLAGTQFDLAKERDPKDPTPYFYDAIRKQTENRPVEALRDLEKSIELNDNRAVYRSKLLLDEDLAARSASLARIYGDLGFEQLGLVEGYKSLATDPGNYSAHRFLADSYASRPLHEIARVSELLQAQLLQPINIKPTQPQLAETNQVLLDGAGSANASFNEFNPLFNRDRLTLQASGIVGNDNTIGDELVLAGLKGKVSYNLGQFHYETDGPRNNNDVKQDIYNVFMQGNITPKTSLQGEFRSTRTEHGDIKLHFNPLLDELRRESDSDTFRIGYHYAPAPHSDFITSVIHQTKSVSRREIRFVPVSRAFGPHFRTDRFDSDSDADLAELQYLSSAEQFNLIVGAGYYKQDIGTTGGRERRNLGGVLIAAEPDSPGSVNIRHTNLYAYSLTSLVQNFALVAGLSADFFEQTAIPDRNQINPKLGFVFKPSPLTAIRAAAFRELKRSQDVNQTIEPTQVAGFNQFFDDVNGTDSKRYAFAIDQKVSSSWFAGIELSKRDLQVPIGTRLDDWNQQLHHAYVYWTPTSRLAVSAGYEFERFTRDFVRGSATPQDPSQVKTHRLPLGANYFHPAGFFAGARASYVNQTVEFPNSSGSTDVGGAHFWIADASIGYRLPKHWGTISLDVKNLFNKDFRFQDTDLVGEPRLQALFQPKRSMLLRFRSVF